MNQSFTAEGVQFAWDSTSLKLYDECPRKYQYKMIEGWQTRNKSHHLIFGAHYATALEHFYKHRALGDSLEEALEKVVHEALINTWEYARNSAGEIVGGAPWRSPDSAKTRENLIRTIIWYVDHFADEEIKVLHLSDGRPAVEYSFTLNVDDGIVFCGHLDRVVEYSHDPFIMDQKTSGGVVSQYYFNQFAPDIQMSLYSFAGKAIFNIPVKGVIIDAAQIAVGFSRFERGFTFRTEDQLTEWYDTTMKMIHGAQRATKEQHFPMRTTSCGNYGGCEFRPICSRQQSIRKNFLNADFTQGPSWDPLAKR